MTTDIKTHTEGVHQIIHAPVGGGSAVWSGKDRPCIEIMVMNELDEENMKFSTDKKRSGIFSHD